MVLSKMNNHEHRTSFNPSLLLRRFVFRMAEASAKRVTGDEPQGTMGRVQTAGEAVSIPYEFLMQVNKIQFKETVRVRLVLG